jgi:hypothetical protein
MLIAKSGAARNPLNHLTLHQTGIDPSSLNGRELGIRQDSD